MFITLAYAVMKVLVRWNGDKRHVISYILAALAY